jgi:hypothetical protein
MPLPGSLVQRKTKIGHSASALYQSIYKLEISNKWYIKLKYAPNNLLETNDVAIVICEISLHHSLGHYIMTPHSMGWCEQGNILINYWDILEDAPDSDL